jgi:hypothetical protein
VQRINKIIYIILTKYEHGFQKVISCSNCILSVHQLIEIHREFKFNRFIKAKAVPLHATELLLGEKRYTSYSFLTSALDGGEWSVSCPSRTLGPGKGPRVPIVQDAGWAPEQVWTQRLEEESFRFCQGLKLDLPVIQPVARHYLTEPSSSLNRLLELDYKVLFIIIIDLTALHGPLPSSQCQIPPIPPIPPIPLS